MNQYLFSLSYKISRRFAKKLYKKKKLLKQLNTHEGLLKVLRTEISRLRVYLNHLEDGEKLLEQILLVERNEKNAEKTKKSSVRKKRKRS